MVRLILRIVLALVANALGLIVADIVLDDVSLTAEGFLIAVAVFTVAAVVVQPLIVKLTLQQGSALAGSSALLATLAGLVVTSIVSDGLRIRGALTWVLATVIVWAVSMIGGFVLPALFLKQQVAQRRA